VLLVAPPSSMRALHAARGRRAPLSMAGDW
jgi:hypothetical protein